MQEMHREMTKYRFAWKSIGPSSLSSKSINIILSGCLPEPSAARYHTKEIGALQTQRRPVARRLIAAGVLLASLFAMASSSPAGAQSPLSSHLTGSDLASHLNGQDAVRYLIREFVSVGGYFFTDSNTADNVLGSTKFFGNGGFYVRPARLGRDWQISGGYESLSAKDHWLPFSGGNKFTLDGISFRIDQSRNPDHIHPHAYPYFSAGYFSGHINSEKQNFKVTRWVPSMSVGVGVLFGRYFRVVASYRVTQHIRGVNTDGFGIELKSNY